MRAIRFAFACLLAGASVAGGQSTNLGVFSNHADIGNTAKAGSVRFDPTSGTYVIAGGGDNMWFTNDALHFAWKQMSADVSLAADIRWTAMGGQAHRKACLLIRQSLAPDSPYVDVAQHGNGLTSLQYRETPGGQTHEIQSNVSGPARVRIEKRGEYVSLFIAASGEELQPAGASIRVPFADPFYVGLGVCAHDNNASEQAEFSEVRLAALPPSIVLPTPRVESTLETITLSSTDRRVVYHTRDHIEAPNWAREGYFIFNSAGRLFKLRPGATEPEPINTGAAANCNNDHGISPDGTQIAISDQSDGNVSRVHVLPITGGAPRLVTTAGPSYWHGWSPDGATLAFCGERNGEFDIYTVPVGGGDERRLTTAPGLDDGPDYSPDGRYIYFNSERSGRMQIWRMKPDGSEQEQVTSDDFNNWFPHPSPDGKTIVFLTYPNDVTGHPENKDVMLRTIPARGGPITVLAKLYGGQGTINVPSWSPDSQQLAFVSYQLVYPGAK